jgi:D-alanyl-D-alanine dipeptidase
MPSALEAMEDATIRTVNTPGEDQDELDRVIIVDNGEPMIDFLGVSSRLIMMSVRPRMDWPRVHLVRQSVAEMLVQAAEALPAGLRLCVIEGYRPIQVQRAMYRFATGRVTQEHPDWNAAQIATEAGRWSAPPDAITPPPHITGGAVDLEIVDSEGKTLDFC